jgi:8-oxo-dGTP pyrophosphatase MutT (NUDIX family)
MLDNLVGGGIASGATIQSTVVKESWEEAGIEAGTAARAVRTAELTIFRQQPDGIQHETIYAHDLWLPAGWSPTNQDGEAVGHRLVPLADVARIIGCDTGPDVMTADASLVARDCLDRLGALPLC